MERFLGSRSGGLWSTLAALFGALAVSVRESPWHEVFIAAGALCGWLGRYTDPVKRKEDANDEPA